ncbi:tRNA(His) guanylyltransferase Thg1 family protein [Acinetobacter bereziniae]|uniref:tRNA(His) guanylyltransferase Thg1 family protein n=1 Tax=Acinetobacter bereziniae TaxID=106648 RepID=UPI001ABCFD42|nr:tRNA(His) guanylyltransferase Thg1 family protein [Acinetobacter bereziniae]MBO3655501.1 guanylyltransferase [Acinetobacter bereziniae]
MRFDDLDRTLRVFETAYDFCVPPEQYIVVRLDGRGFTRLTKEVWQFEAPFDIRFRDLMVETTAHLMQCGFNIIYGYTQSDEISLLFHFKDDSFNRKTRKIISILAAEASAKFSVLHSEMATFDARICILPNAKMTEDYFRWRHEDAHRNALNAHCYWMLRKEGETVKNATNEVKGLNRQEKHDLLFSREINFNELPSWQKRGTGLYWTDIEKTGFNPKTKQPTVSTRRQIFKDYELPLGDDYSQFIQQQFLLNQKQTF